MVGFASASGLGPMGFFCHGPAHSEHGSSFKGPWPEKNTGRDRRPADTPQQAQHSSMKLKDGTREPGSSGNRQTGSRSRVRQCSPDLYCSTAVFRYDCQLQHQGEQYAVRCARIACALLPRSRAFPSTRKLAHGDMTGASVVRVGETVTARQCMRVPRSH